MLHGKRYFWMEKEFYEPLLTVGAPIALQNLIAALLNMVDTVMIGGLGKTEIAAVGLANQIFFIFHLLAFGINSGAAIFFAQFWGQRDIKNIRRVMGAGLISGVIVGAFFTLVATIFPEAVLSIFSNDINVIRLGAQYMRLVSIGYIPSVISFSYGFVLRCTGQVMPPMKASMISLGINTLFNYFLIYGQFGFPRMEVAGAALATSLARVFEMIFILFIVYRNAWAPAAKLRELIDVNWAFICKFFRTTIPVILNELLWALGVTMFAVVYGRMGTDIIAGVNIFSTIERISMVFFFGLAQACAVTIGHRIGEGREEKAFQIAREYATVGPVVGLLIGGILLALSRPFLMVYQVSGPTLTVARQILFVYCLIMPLKVFNLINIVGILRSGGDTRFSLILDVGALWLVAVPLAFLAAFIWRLPPPMVYLMVATEELFKNIVGVPRLLSGKWINNLTHGMGTVVEAVSVESESA
jgi:putative MATE family efflux protein